MRSAYSRGANVPIGIACVAHDAAAARGRSGCAALRAPEATLPAPLDTTAGGGLAQHSPC